MPLIGKIEFYKKFKQITLLRFHFLLLPSSLCTFLRRIPQHSLSCVMTTPMLKEYINSTVCKLLESLFANVIV
jgi:hypothetical protein